MEISPGNRHRNAIRALELSTRRTNVHNVDTFRHSRASFRAFFDHIPLLIEFLSLSDTEYIFSLSSPKSNTRSLFFLIYFSLSFARAFWNSRRYHLLAFDAARDHGAILQRLERRNSCEDDRIMNSFCVRYFDRLLKSVHCVACLHCEDCAFS